MTEDQIRMLIRQEIAGVLRDLAKEASDADRYDTRELESAGLQAVARVAGTVAKAVAETVGMACEECGEVTPEHWWKCSRG